MLTLRHRGHVTPGAIWPYGAIWGHRAFCPYGPNEHVEWALQNVTDTSTADSTTHRAVSWGPYGPPRAVVAPETRMYVAFEEPRNGYTDGAHGTLRSTLR